MFSTLIIVGNIILIFTKYCVGGASSAVIADFDIICSYFVVGITTDNNIYYYSELYISFLK